jgi:hypothetical protein
MARAKKGSISQSRSKKDQKRGKGGLKESELAAASGGGKVLGVQVPNPIKGIANAVGLRHSSEGVPKVKPTGQHGVGPSEVLPIWEAHNTTEPGRPNAPRR